MSVSISDSVFFLISLNRREAILLPSLQQGFCRQVQSQGSPTDPFGCEKIPMQELLQNLLQDVSSAQAWGIWLLCSTLNWDTFPRTDKKKEKKKTLVLLYFSKAQENCQGITSRGFVPKDFFFSLLLLRAVNFISEWEIALCSRASRLKQCFLWLQSVPSFVIPCTHLPVLFMHFSACLECFICLHNVICSVCTNVSRWLLMTVLHSFKNEPHKRYQRAHYEWQYKYS